MLVIALLLLIASVFRGRFIYALFIINYLIAPISHIGAKEQYSSEFVAMIYVSAVFSILLTLFLLSSNSSLPISKILSKFRVIIPSNRSVVILYIVSLAMLFLYVYLIRDSLLLMFASQIAGDASVDISGIRLSMYDSKYSDTYTAPGFFNQFKNMLIPFISAWLISLQLKKITLSRNIIKLIACVITIFLLLAIAIASSSMTFQRSILILNVCSVIIATAYAHRDLARSMISSLRINKKLIKFMVGIIAAIGLVFLYWTRSSSVLYSDVSFNDLNSLIERIFLHQYRGASAAFAVIEDDNLQYGGYVFNTFASITPLLRNFVERNDVAYQAHLLCCGSDRGTAPLDFIGVSWYNFGVIGVALWTSAIFLLAHACEISVHRLTKLKHLMSFKIYSYNLLLTSFVSVWLCISIGDPVQILNNGMVLLLFLFRGFGMHREILERYIHNTPI